MDPLSFSSVWLRQRLEQAVDSIPAGNSLLVSVPPCVFHVDPDIDVSGRKATFIADPKAWNVFRSDATPLKNPICAIAPFPWWDCEVDIESGDFDNAWWLDCQRTYFSRCTDSELETLLEIEVNQGNGECTDISTLRWVSGGWPGLAWAWLNGRASGGLEGGEDRLGFIRMQAHFENSWSRVIATQLPELRTLCTLPWLDHNLLRQVFRVGAGERQALLNHAWLFHSPEKPDRLELDATLQRLAAAMETPVSRKLEMTRAWYAAGGHLPEAVHCAVALGIPLDDLAAKALMRGSDPTDHDHSGSKHRRVGVRKAGSAWEEELSGALRRAYEAIEIQRKPISSEVLKPLASVLNRSGQLGTTASLVGQLNSFSDAAREPHQLRRGSGFEHIALGVQSRSALLALQQDPLNHRESQILRKICKGLRNRDISHQLGLEISTVKWYATRIYAKLGVKNRTQAVVRAQELGLSE